MTFGSTNLAATPCCGIITRSWECFPDQDSPTGARHNPGSGEESEYVPSFEDEDRQLRQGICPDCRQSFLGWLVENGRPVENPFGFLEWNWDYNRALQKFLDGNN